MLALVRLNFLDVYMLLSIKYTNFKFIKIIHELPITYWLDVSESCAAVKQQAVKEISQKATSPSWHPLQRLMNSSNLDPHLIHVPWAHESAPQMASRLLSRFFAGLTCCLLKLPNCHPSCHEWFLPDHDPSGVLKIIVQKMMDQMARHENAGHENDWPNYVKMTDVKLHDVASCSSMDRVQASRSKYRKR